MFYYMSGRVAAIEQNLVVIDCGGVGYALRVSLNTAARARVGEQLKLYTHLYVREDAFELFGFGDLAEKRCFEMLMDVSGVGPKVAVNILSAATPEQFAMGIVSGDEKVLTAAAGVGKKIAQRIILELKDKLAKEMPAIAAPAGMELPAFAAAHTPRAEAVTALMVLGYARRVAETAVGAVDASVTKLEDIIRLALQNIGD